ncbi:nucleotidyltransferase domain-containing protein [Wenzhouxiangella sp. AB-CW3]|uniref:nucleotidyltransferase domain-containing protein n=1 Tax=Wenzhouxiangella sp. AB-CW3 TaxID=2771012 RepID=UPI00168AA98A|nr:nucleotidyltransferase domain-containing protein [Wenzhouxiangella sp. AB-CW3]QOC23771.1 nucleotidyltransferase domain-containing protein [Wenzhouxiangella sp. AB-CW3]
MNDAAANLLFGKTRRAVFSVLFETPERACYLRELARITGVSPGTLQQELQRLVQAELVIRKQDGNRVTYSANAAHPVFAELQGLIRKTCGIPAQLHSILEPLADRLHFAAIYGSVAKGTARADSDIDLIVAGDISLAEMLEHLQPLEQSLGREINARVFTKKEFQIRMDNADPFLTRVLSGPTIPLIDHSSDA